MPVTPLSPDLCWQKPDGRSGPVRWFPRAICKRFPGRNCKIWMRTESRARSPICPKTEPRVILDGLLGLGSRSGLNAPLKALTREINALRLKSNATVYAVDLPTGLGEESIDPDAVVADFTLTIGFAKTALFRDEATNFVGRIQVIDLPELTSRSPKEPARTILSGAANLREFVPRRLFDSHKGDFGRVGIVAGSRGLVGASVLCSEAAARAGGGLISLYVPEEIYSLVVSKVTPEIMVKPTRDFRSVLDERLDALGIGPGSRLDRTAGNPGGCHRICRTDGGGCRRAECPVDGSR